MYQKMNSTAAELLFSFPKNQNRKANVGDILFIEVISHMHPAWNTLT